MAPDGTSSARSLKEEAAQLPVGLRRQQSLFAWAGDQRDHAIGIVTRCRGNDRSLQRIDEFAWRRPFGQSPMGRLGVRYLQPHALSATESLARSGPTRIHFIVPLRPATGWRRLRAMAQSRARPGGGDGRVHLEYPCKSGIRPSMSRSLGTFCDGGSVAVRLRVGSGSTDPRLHTGVPL